MKRIAIDARFWLKETGGIGRYSKNLVRELAKLDNENEYTVIIPTAGQEQYDISASNFKPLVCDIPYYSYAEQKDLATLLNKQNFDLVHFTGFNHPILYRKPFVVTFHDLIIKFFPSGAQQTSAIRRAAFDMVAGDCKRAKAIIVPSEATKKDIVKIVHANPDNVIVTLEGSESSFRKASQSSIDAVREKYHLPKRYLIFVGRWEPYKGLPVLLEAFDELSKNDPELGLVICGRPISHRPEVGELVDYAQKNNKNIITPGFVTDDELVALYSGASAFTFPSLYEGFGIMVLEAFAIGVPVVTSNVSSLAEVAGDAALLADPKSSTDFASKIKMILDDPGLASELCRKGTERVKQFSWKKMAEETLAVYIKALRNGN